MGRSGGHSSVPLQRRAQALQKRGRQKKKKEVLAPRFHAEIPDRGGAAACGHTDTSHYQRLRVIEITFFLCKLNGAWGSFANCEYVALLPTLVKFK